MEFLRAYAMAGLPVFLAFAAIGWFMAVSAVPRRRRADAEGGPPEAERPVAMTGETRLQKAA